jgi:hypothetical protein
MAVTPSARAQRVKPGPQLTRPAWRRLTVFKNFAAKSPGYCPNYRHVSPHPTGAPVVAPPEAAEEEAAQVHAPLVPLIDRRDGSGADGL